MKCCICGVEIKGWGNNPWPLSEGENDRCCDVCNDTRVIPERIKRMQEGKSIYEKE